MKKPQWEVLYEMLQDFPIPSITIEKMPTGYRLKETFGSRELLTYDRYLDGGRATHYDSTGFIGLSTLTFKAPLIITEGVSDFLVANHLSSGDVLGLTRLRLNRKQIHVLKTLGLSTNVLADNDATGLKAAYERRKILTSMGLKVNIITPPNYKDLVDFWIDSPTQALNFITDANRQIQTS